MMHSSALYINQINSALDNAGHFDFPAVRFQEGLVFFFGPFVCEADAHEAQDFLPQVLLAAFAEKKFGAINKPPSFKTRRISSSAFSEFGIIWSAFAITTMSKELSAKRKEVASATSKLNHTFIIDSINFS